MLQNLNILFKNVTSQRHTTLQKGPKYIEIGFLIYINNEMYL